MTIADQVRIVRQKIGDACRNAGRSPNEVRLLGVSKTKPASMIVEAAKAGISDFGESYAQEAVEKVQALAHLSVNWHFIGPLQSNKTRPIAEHFDWVHSADRAKILQRLNDHRPEEKNPLNICIQVNAFAEPQKKGASLAELPDLIALTNDLPRLKLRGLMLIPPKSDDYHTQYAQFCKMAEMFEQYKQQADGSLEAAMDSPLMDTLSMGMSGDIEAAIAAGSNCVRVGSAIFGARD